MQPTIGDRIRRGIGQLKFRQTPFDLPLLLFFLTLFMGMWVAYSGRLALYKFWMMVTAIILFYVVTAVPRHYAWWLAWACGPLAACLTAYAITAGQWQQLVASVATEGSPFYLLLSLRQFWPLFAPHGNVIGGLLAMLVPFMLATLAYARQHQRGKWVWSTAVCLAIAVVGLLYTQAVAAMLFLLAGLLMWPLWLLSAPLQRPLRLPRIPIYIILLGLGLIAGLSLLWWVATAQLWGYDDLMQRYWLVEQTIPLAQTYVWTGSGLSSFAALYAEYVQVVPQFFVSYSNFYLDVWVELGLVGFVAVTAVWLGAFGMLAHALQREADRPDGAQSRLYYLRWATLISLVVTLGIGLTDDLLYSGLGTPWLFFVPAMASLICQRGPVRAVTAVVADYGIWLTAFLFLLAIGLFMGRQTVLASWHTNQGALLMDQLLLPGWPRNEWHEVLPATAVAEAQAHLQQAVLLADGQGAPWHRLGYLAWLQHDFATAQTQLTQALYAQPFNRGALKLLAYTAVWQADWPIALPILLRVPEASAELEAYAGWWPQQGQPQLAERAAIAADALKNNPNP